MHARKYLDIQATDLLDGILNCAKKLDRMEWQQRVKTDGQAMRELLYVARFEHVSIFYWKS